MSDQDSTSPFNTNELVERIHDIQEEIFLREDQIDELLDSSDAEEPLRSTIEEGKSRRRYLHLKRMRADWDRMVERSREEGGDNDFELAAALVHFIGDILVCQAEGVDEEWVEQLKQYLVDYSAQVN